MGIVDDIRKAGQEALAKAEAEKKDPEAKGAPDAAAPAPEATTPAPDATAQAPTDAPAAPADKPKAAEPARKPAPPAPKKTHAAPKKQRVYTVKSGDTLSGIGQRFGVSWQKIYAANKGKIKDPDLIYPGQEFVIPD